MVLKGYSNEEIIDIVPNSNDNIIKEIIFGRTWNSVVSVDIVNLMKNTRYPVILTVEQKHQICKYFESNPINSIYKGTKKII